MIHSYPWYIQEWVMSRARAVLNMEERGLFREVLDVLYNNEGILEPDEQLIRRQCGCEPSEWKRAWPKVRRLLDDMDGGKLSHPKVRDVVSKLEKYHAGRVAAGKSGAQRKWKGKQSMAEPEVEDGSAILHHKIADGPPLPLPLPQHQAQHQAQPLPLPSTDLVPIKRTEIADPLFAELRVVCRKRHVLQPDSDDDWAQAALAWGTLDSEQRMKALEDCGRRPSDSFEMRANPQTYLHRKWWKRDHPSNSKAPEKLANNKTLTAMQIAFGGKQ